MTLPRQRRARESQMKATTKSQLSQANYCKEPVTLPPAPWDKPEVQEDEK